MNISLYSLAMNSHHFINIMFLGILVFTLWSLLSEDQKTTISLKLKKYLPPKLIRKTDKHRVFVQPQFLMLISVIIVNFFSFVVYDDYYDSTRYLSITISITQVVALVRVFITKLPKPANHSFKISLMLGMLSIILAFTHIYFYLFVNFRNGFANFDLLGMNSNRIDDWLNCLFYSVSLIIPYSLTELIPNTYLMKSISLIQIILFYVFVFKRLSSIFTPNDNRS